MLFPRKVITNTNNYNSPVQISPKMDSALKSMEFKMCGGPPLAWCLLCRQMILGYLAKRIGIWFTSIKIGYVENTWWNERSERYADVSQCLRFSWCCTLSPPTNTFEVFYNIYWIPVLTTCKSLSRNILLEISNTFVRNAGLKILNTMILFHVKKF